jgi:peptide/nickel transport system permease protein
MLSATRGSIGFGLGLFLTIFVLCLAAPLFTADPNEPDLLGTLQPPSAEHWFGTDGSGRDVFARVLHGGRVDILLAVVGVLLSFAVGGPLGLMLGFFRNRLTEAVMRVLDVLQAFPLLVFALTLLAFTGPEYETFIYAIAFVATPLFLRLVRSETLAVRARPFVEAAEAAGNPRLRVMFRHVLPNVLTSALTQLTTSMASAILLIGALSFLGVGIRPPTAEWGSMIHEGRTYAVTGQWWPTMFPGLGIVLTVLALHTMGEGFVRRRRVV